MIAWLQTEGKPSVRRWGPHLTLCKSILVALERPELFLRYWDSGNHERWHWRQRVEDICEGRYGAKSSRKYMVSSSGYQGKLLTFAPGDCQTRTDFTTKLVLAFVLKSIFRQVRASLNVPGVHK